MTSVKGDIYEVTVEGKYYSNEAGRKAEKPYKVTVKMDEQAKHRGFLSVARNEILPRLLAKKYPDYKRFRTHTVTEVKNITKGGTAVNELNFMNRNQIVAFITQRQLPIEYDLYPQIEDLRQALRNYRDNRDMFLKMQDKRKMYRTDELTMKRAIDELNPELSGDPITEPVEMQAEEVKSEEKSVYGDFLSIPEFDEPDELDSLIDGV